MQTSNETKRCVANFESGSATQRSDERAISEDGDERKASVEEADGVGDEGLVAAAALSERQTSQSEESRGEYLLVVHVHCYHHHIRRQHHPPEHTASRARGEHFYHHHIRRQHHTPEHTESRAEKQRRGSQWRTLRAEWRNRGWARSGEEEKP